MCIKQRYVYEDSINHGKDFGLYSTIMGAGSMKRFNLYSDIFRFTFFEGHFVLTVANK